MLMGKFGSVGPSRGSEWNPFEPQMATLSWRKLTFAVDCVFSRRGPC